MKSNDGKYGLFFSFFNSVVPANAVDAVSIPGLGRSPGGGSGTPLQYSCLENPMDRGAWRAIIRESAKSQPRLLD